MARSNATSFSGDVQCFGHDCYPLAFGVPAILMVISVIIFVSGSSLYKRYPPEGNIVVEVSKAVGVSIQFSILLHISHFLLHNTSF